MRKPYPETGVISTTTLGGGTNYSATKRKAIIVLGQSNVAGVNPTFGIESPITGALNLRVKQFGLYDDMKDTTMQLGVGNLNAVGANNSRVGFSYSLASAFADSINDDVYVISSADGGTGFQEGSWAAGGALYTDLMAQVSRAVYEGYDIVGVFWGLGESDSLVSSAFRGFEHLMHSTISELRTIAGNAGQLNADKIPFVTYNMVAAWVGTNAQRLVVQAALQSVGSVVPYSANADFSGLPASITGDLIHYDARQNVEIGKRLFNAVAVANSSTLTVTPPNGEIVLSNQLVPSLFAYGLNVLDQVGTLASDPLYSRLGEAWKYKNSRGVFKYRMEWELSTGEIHNIVWEQDRIPFMTTRQMSSASLISATAGAIFGDTSSLGINNGFNGLAYHRNSSLIKLGTGSWGDNTAMIAQNVASGDGSSTYIAILQNGTPLGAVRTTLYAVVD